MSGLPDIVLFKVDTKDMGPALRKLLKVFQYVVSPFVDSARIRRVADANKHAAITEAEARAEVTSIESQTVDRLLGWEIRRTSNLNRLGNLTAQLLPAEVSEVPVDEDWITAFFAYAQDISDEQMQLLWARLLAGEIEQPGQFSLRTLRAVKDLSKREAELITRLASGIWTIDGMTRTAVLPSVNDPSVRSLGLSYEDLTHLHSIGIIHLDDISLKTLDDLTGRTIRIDYFGTAYLVTLPGMLTYIPVGPAMLTETGRELIPVARGEPNPDYHEQILQHWRASLYVIESADLHP